MVLGNTTEPWRGIPSITRNPEEFSSKQRKRQVKLLSMEEGSLGLDVVLHAANSSVGKAGKPKGK